MRAPCSKPTARVGSSNGCCAGARDDSIEIYARLNDDEWAEWLAKAAEAQVDSTIVPRLPTIDASPAEYERYQQTALGLLKLDPAQGARPRSAEL